MTQEQIINTNAGSAPEELKVLEYIRSRTGIPFTTGLNVKQISRFLNDRNLLQALSVARENFDQLFAQHSAILKLPEEKAINLLQNEVLNFYPSDSVSPYVPLVAKGPWIITCYGAIVYDTGGYGMLGFGHQPDFVETALNKPKFMSNVMTPSFAQKEVTDRLRKEVGRNRSTGCPYSKFVFLNSGSESMTIGLRISDLNAKTLTDPGQKYDGWKVKLLALKGAFHGRTDRPARVSNSCFEKYQSLASFRNYEGTIFVEPNNIQELDKAFNEARQNKVFFEAMVLEPVMGEGNPGQAITKEFYAKARELTEQMGTLLIVDSIQAGFRAEGTLSIADYCGFTVLPAPDMETYSKAINAGQYPVSILAVNEKSAGIYKSGVYGNTMTTNPRALSVTCSVFDNFTESIRKNIISRGLEFLGKLKTLKEEISSVILSAQGTGLLLAIELDKRIKTVGRDSIEDRIRKQGVNLIHGGKNALRFTPHFLINSSEIELIIEVVRAELKNVRLD